MLVWGLAAPAAGLDNANVDPAAPDLHLLHLPNQDASIVLLYPISVSKYIYTGITSYCLRRTNNASNHMVAARR